MCPKIGHPALSSDTLPQVRILEVRTKQEFVAALGILRNKNHPSQAEKISKLTVPHNFYKIIFPLQELGF